MAKKKVVKRVKPTLLAVGEGHCEKAFLAHLKGLYSDGSVKISICTAKGKGPEHIIKHAISCKKCDGYDSVIVLLDTDLEWPSALVSSIAGKGIILVGSEPCLEGFLLDIIGVRKATSSAECKDQMHGMLDGPATDRDSYQVLFQKEILDAAMANSAPLRALIKAYRGK